MLRFLLHASLALLCFLAVIVAIAGALLLSAPRPNDIKSCITATMHNVSLCATDKSYVKFSAISPHIRNAVIVSEDAGFYGHSGLDFYELKMSFEENLKEGRFARGGSTITQQLAKNVYLSGEKSLVRKAREALIALQIEKILTKDEILEKYLNVVEFGPNIYGVKKATQHYFDKSPSEVTVLEGAWLAFLLPNPAKYSQSFRKRELTNFARNQIKIIVIRMARYSRITLEEEADALAQLENMFRPVEELEDSVEAVGEDSSTPVLDAELQTDAQAESVTQEVVDPLETHETQEAMETIPPPEDSGEPAF